MPSHEDETPTDRPARYSVHVFPADDLTVTAGANIGDSLGYPDGLSPGDIYQLKPDANPRELVIGDLPGMPPVRKVAKRSEIGTVGGNVTLLARLTFVGDDGDLAEILAIGLDTPEGQEGESEICFLPLSPVMPKTPYTLVDFRTDPGDVRLADIMPVAFARGTLITLADGTQRAVEDLAAGDLILTRDSGPQPLRWIGQRNLRAIGPHAPVVIPRRALGNDNDLAVSQFQRLFVYQRGDRQLAETAEVLIKARDLVDGKTIDIREGGFIEYFHLVLDQHEIIYAECIPTESLLVDRMTGARMHEDLAREVRARFPELCHKPHIGSDADGALVARLGASGLGRSTRRR